MGTAGSGKTSLTHCFQNWMQHQGLDCVTVNLDPGAERLPYSPDVDIREWLSLKQVMDEYGLGPNGAQVACADLLALRAGEVQKVLEGFRTNYILFDTPGQLELFAFRKSSRVVLETLTGERSFIVFLIDPTLAKVPSGYLAEVMLSATVQFRLGTPLVNVLSKADLLEPGELERMKGWAADPYRLQSEAASEVRGPQTLLSLGLFRALEDLGALRDFSPVSSEEPAGLEDIYTAIQNHFAGGEDLSRD